MTFSISDTSVDRAKRSNSCQLDLCLRQGSERSEKSTSKPKEAGVRDVVALPT